ncbi:MAG: histone deacetylase family protein [Paracoccaceae bacterium]
MYAFFDARQWHHDPQHFLVRGLPRPSPEQPERIARLKAGAEAGGLRFAVPVDRGLGPLAAVHTPEYLDFLRNIHARWRALPDAGPEVVPNIHPSRGYGSYPTSAVGQAGYHQADTACPIGPDTWEAAYWSAQSALAAAHRVLEGDRAAYALSRPPGHHAFADLAGGFCFLNNAAIAAEHALRAGRRPAILDIDVHHGNGTQGIFYARGDVLTVSIHADPDAFYPFFWGHAQERGTGPGLGANLNLPLAHGTGTEGVLDALDAALCRIDAFGTDLLVVALGLDAHERDPLRGLTVTTEGFARIAARIGATGLPLVLVQEGGYLSEDLGANLTSFLSGLAPV